MATQPVATTATASGTRVLKESRDMHMEKVDVYSFMMICSPFVSAETIVDYKPEVLLAGLV